MRESTGGDKFLGEIYRVGFSGGKQEFISGPPHSTPHSYQRPHSYTVKGMSAESRVAITDSNLRLQEGRFDEPSL
jgi:hypothetical protein